MTSEIILSPSPDLRPAPLFAPTRKAAQRFLGFFTAQINNANTRRAYINASRRFADWCASEEIYELAQVQPFHVAATGIEFLGCRFGIAWLNRYRLRYWLRISALLESFVNGTIS
jgi:hypothetical protein